MTKLASLSDYPGVTGDALRKESVGGVHRREWTESDEKKLEAACAEFESLFINLVMKQMRKPVAKSGRLMGGKGEEIFTEMMDEDLSKQMSLREGIGLRGH